MKNLLLIVASLFMVACAHRWKVLDAPAVSMSHESIAPEEKLEMKGSVAAEYCTDTFKDKGDIGLMDEAIKKAQAENQVDVILNATFWSSPGCMSIEGQGAKIINAKN